MILAKCDDQNERGQQGDNGVRSLDDASCDLRVRLHVNHVIALHHHVRIFQAVDVGQVELVHLSCSRRYRSRKTFTLCALPRLAQTTGHADHLQQGGVVVLQRNGSLHRHHRRERQRPVGCLPATERTGFCSTRVYCSSKNVSASRKVMPAKLHPTEQGQLDQNRRCP